MIDIDNYSIWEELEVEAERLIRLSNRLEDEEEKADYWDEFYEKRERR